MKFLPLFEIRFNHAYYTSGRCSALSIEPTDDGHTFARNHRLVIKQRVSGALVLTPVKPDQTPQIPFSPGATMTFHLRQTNRQLPLFTDLTGHASMTAPLYNNASITAGQGGELSLVDQPGTPLYRGVFANVEIGAIDAMVPSAGPLAFDISLSPKAARWTYYVVTDIDPGAFTLVDSDPTTGATLLQFAADNNPRDLVSQPDPGDAMAVELEDNYPTMRRLRFVTSDPISFRQEPRKYIELHIDGVRQAGALPNPPFGNHAMVEMTIDSVTQSHPSFFRLIKHITQPFSTT